MLNSTTPDHQAASPQTSGPVGPSAHGQPGLVPPHNLDAEQAVLGAGMYSHTAIDLARPLLESADFYRPAHGDIWRALLAQRDAGDPTDPIALGERLQRTGALARIGGRDYLHQLAACAPGTANCDYYAHIVRGKSDLRRLQAAAIQTVQQSSAEGADPEQLRALLTGALVQAAERSAASGGGRLDRFAVDGWSFVTGYGTATAPIWGTPGQTAWASGESLMIAGPPGVGKSTIAHQLVMGRLGLMPQVLGMPVAEGKRVLYLAMDRPPQIARAFERLVGPADQDILRERLMFWGGPLPTTLDKEPNLLVDLAGAHGADTVVIDSVKDVVAKLTDDESVGAYNRARQQLLRSGVELLELHHQRKATAEAKRTERPTLDKVYGTTWFTAGAGSVMILSGGAGDAAIKLHHAKTVTGEIGPLTVIHDHQRGTSRVDTDLDPYTLLCQTTGGLTCKELATHITGKPSPDRAEVQQARRTLDALERTGQAARHTEPGSSAIRYLATARPLTVVS